MFARISTFQTGPDSTDEVTKDTVNQVLQMPGCRGMYFLRGTDNKSLSITLWENEEALKASAQAADRIRSEVSAGHHMPIVSVEAFEVLTRQLKD